MKEFDYRKEASNQEAIRLGLSQAGYDRSVVVPKPYSELCTREVLVMEYIPGVKLTDVVRQRPKAQAKAKGAAAIAAGGGTPASLGGGESWWGRTIGAYFSRRYARSLVDEVVRVHGHQILKMGLFNGSLCGMDAGTSPHSMPMPIQLTIQFTQNRGSAPRQPAADAVGQAGAHRLRADQGAQAGAAPLPRSHDRGASGRQDAGGDRPLRPDGLSLPGRHDWR